MEDHEIVSLYLHRNEDAIQETDKKYHHYGMKLSMNILKNKSDSEECLNDTYIALWNHIPPTIPQSLKYYLGRIIKNISFNVYKRKKNQEFYILEELEQCIPSSFDVEYEIEKKELTRIIENILKNQKDYMQKIFVLRYWYGESIDHISKQCHLSQNQVKVYLHRIRKKIKEELEKEKMLS